MVTLRPGPGDVPPTCSEGRGVTLSWFLRTELQELQVSSWGAAIVKTSEARSQRPEPCAAWGQTGAI